MNSAPQYQRWSKREHQLIAHRSHHVPIHFFIHYQTWTGSSIWMRFTGVGVMGVAYGYFIAYALNPFVGWNLGSESLIATFAIMSPLAKGSIKFGLSWPFVFHFVNGIKQLVYDMGIGYEKRTIEASNNWPFVIGVFGALILTFAL
ncbi:unnamed protein product [Clonostachys rhizophaga]|uniref:Uncharacterized protein n=1 Tax=Clonostachys rhizophaga TaxID=160324 RepID=A0A9N9YJV4_9HYPO|nr:unnamed protein product [Clonostachys rhizophaga]